MPRQTKTTLYFIQFCNDIVHEYDRFFLNTENEYINTVEWNNYIWVVKKRLIGDTLEHYVRRTNKHNNEFEFVYFYKFEDQNYDYRLDFIVEDRMENDKYYGKPIGTKLYLNGYIFNCYDHYHKRIK